jgi:hypothetical protein
MTNDEFKKFQHMQNSGSQRVSKRRKNGRLGCPCCICRGPTSLRFHRKLTRRRARTWLKHQDRREFRNYL